MQLGRKIPGRRTRFAARLALFGLCLWFTSASRSRPARPEQKTTQAAPDFSDADAAVVCDRLRRALEADSERGVLQLFDAKRMPDYPALRDQLDQFFAKYQAFRLYYQITRASREGAVGVVLADVSLEAAPVGGASRNLRRSAQLRLVLAWDGKQWRIVDFSPRDLFA
jgi:hypothetical protein